MKKTITLFGIISFFIVHAQQISDNYVIGILPVTTSDVSVKKYCAQVQGSIANVFTGKKRFTIVDRTKFDELAAERNLQKQEDFLNGLVVEQGKSLGAQYLIQGNISQLSAQPVQISKTKVISISPYQTQKYYVPGYNVVLVINVQIIDVATGQAKSARTFSGSGQYETANMEQAISYALQNSLENYKGDRGLKDWANDMFPVDMKILKIEEADNKGRPKKVLIKGGEDMDLHRGATTGSKLQVYINDVMMVDGKEYTRQLPIGEIVVFEPQGEFTVCKVKDGAEEMLKRMNEGKTLFLKLLKW